jgi:peroxiredoxin/uncharacterized membrane protein YphA (DoxX/SURF4 family)
MAAFLVVARLLIAGVLAVAGVAKLADLTGSRQAMRDFGMPEGLTGVSGAGLPVVEVGLAALLLPRATAPAAAALAGTLLLAFAAGVGAAVTRGEHPDCHCFGQLHSTPAGWSTVVRNLLLAGACGLVAVAGWSKPGASVSGWLGSLSSAQAIGAGAALVLAGVLGFHAWFSLQLLRQNGRLLMRIEALEAAVQGRPAVAIEIPNAPAVGLPVGTPAPAFALPTLDGESVTLDSLRLSGRPVLLVFSDPGCGPCNALLPDVAQWQRSHSQRLTIALVSCGRTEQNAAKAAEHELSHVLLQRDREVAESYRAISTPGAVLVSIDGKIASAAVFGPHPIAALVESATTGDLNVRGPSGNGANGKAPQRPPSLRAHRGSLQAAAALSEVEKP